MPQLPSVSELMISTDSRAERKHSAGTASSPHIPRISSSLIQEQTPSVTTPTSAVPIRRLTDPLIQYHPYGSQVQGYQPNSAGGFSSVSSNPDYFGHSHEGASVTDVHGQHYNLQERHSISSSIGPMSRNPSSSNQYTMSSPPIHAFPQGQVSTVTSNTSNSISAPTSAQHHRPQMAGDSNTTNLPPGSAPPLPVFNYPESMYHQQLQHQHMVPHSQIHQHPSSVAHTPGYRHALNSGQAMYCPVYPDMPYIYQAQAIQYEENNALLNRRRIIKRRTRTGCLTCRKRRIKCDERKPHCFNCERSRKVCLGYENLSKSKKKKSNQDSSDVKFESGDENNDEKDIDNDTNDQQIENSKDQGDVQDDSSKSS